MAAVFTKHLQMSLGGRCHTITAAQNKQLSRYSVQLFCFAFFSRAGAAEREASAYFGFAYSGLMGIVGYWSGERNAERS